MGFAWALDYCHLVLMRCCSLALSIVGVPDDELESCFAVDGRPAPRLSARRPIALPYVDNGNFLCWDKQAADELLLAISSVFKRLGLQFRVECDGASCCDLLGIRLIASSRRLLGKPDRIWKLRTAVIELLHQGRCSSHVLQVVNGHLVFTLLAFRPALAILQDCFSFAGDDNDDVRDIPFSVQRELWTCVNLLPFLGSDLSRDVCGTMLCTDSSLAGYAAHAGVFPLDTVADIAEVQEIWKFKPQRPAEIFQVASQDAAWAAARSPFDSWADSQVSFAAQGALDTRERASRLPAALRSLVAHNPGEPFAIVNALDLEPDQTVYGPFAVPDVSDDVFREHHWECLFVGAWPDTSGPIHTKEATTSLRGYQQLLHLGQGQDELVVSCGDNYAEVLCTAGGRASNWALNSTCRRACGSQPQCNS